MVRRLLVAVTLVLVLIAIAWAPRMRCILEGVQVDTPFGRRPIESLKVGDAVWSRDAAGAPSIGVVTSIGQSRSLRYIRFQLDSGEELAVTPSHPLFVGGRWVEAGRVANGDVLEGRAGRLALARIETSLGWKTVFDISVEPHQTFYANGVLVHNKSPNRSQSQTIGDTRTVISALQTYASTNCGYFARSLTDLTRSDGTPIGIPDYPAEAPEFLESYLARPSPYSKSSYQRSYHGFGRPDAVGAECDPESVLAFCYASTPLRPFKSDWAESWPRLADVMPGLTRNRSFVGTSDGTIYVDPLGRDLSCIDGVPPDFALNLE